MAEVLNASQMQKLQEVFVNCLSENRAPDYLQIRNEEFLDMFLTAKHLEGCSDKTIRYYRCNIQRMLETVVNAIFPHQRHTLPLIHGTRFLFLQQSSRRDNRILPVLRMTARCRDQACPSLW